MALIDQVAKRRDEIVITKRGKPVARLVPIDDPRDHERRLLASWRDQAKPLMDDDALSEPSSELTDWSALVASER